MKLKGKMRKGGLYNMFIFEGRGGAKLELFPNKKLIPKFEKELKKAEKADRRSVKVEMEISGIEGKEIESK